MASIATVHAPASLGVVQKVHVSYGLTIEQIAMRVHGDDSNLTAWLKAPSGHPTEWIELPRGMWCLVRPKVDNVVVFGYRPGKSALRTIFKIAVAIVAIVAAPFLAPILGTVGAALASAAIGLAGAVAANALFPSSVPGSTPTSVASVNSTSAPTAISTASTQPDQSARQFANVESDSNLLAREAYLPVVVGTRRLSPPEISSPRFFLESGVQSIERVFALDGQHSISDIRVDNASVSEYSAITTETRDGAEATPVTTFVDKVVSNIGVGETLSTFELDDTTLVDQVEPGNSSPRWIRFVTKYDEKLEEIVIRFQIDTLIDTNSSTAHVRVPLRIRFRPKGSTGDWNNLPEIHITGRDVSSSIKEFRFRWDGIFNDADTGGEIQYTFFQRVPPATVTLVGGLTGDQWQSHSHFVDHPTPLVNTKNIQGRRTGVLVTLSESEFPKGEFEFEVIRGYTTNTSALNTSTYVLSGVYIESFFVGRYDSGKWNIAVDQGNYLGRITLSQASSIFDRQPCSRPKTALIALKSRGKSVRNVTALASRYVYDWDGSGWNTLTTTLNPATHFRQVLYDYLVYHGIDTSLIANQQIVDWRAECASKGYEVSAIFSGSAIRETLDGIAVAGYARRWFSDGFGVDWFRDRSSDRPVQTLSPRNATISVDWRASEKPVGIRAKFSNEDDDYRDDEVSINNPFYSNFSGYDVREYPTITNPTLVQRRAMFDLLQDHYQGRRVWTIDAATEGLICERGDLVGVVTDLLDDANSGARIRRVIDSTTFTIDQNIPAEDTESIFDVANIFDPADIFTVGEQSVCLVSTPTGTEMSTIVAAETGAEGYLVRVSTPFTSTDLVGAHIVLGPASRFTSRCIVSDVIRKSEERSQLTLVDEAPEIYAQLQERFG